MMDEEREAKKLSKEQDLAIAFAELKCLREAWGTVTTHRVSNGDAIEKELLRGMGWAAKKVFDTANELRKF